MKRLLLLGILLSALNISTSQKQEFCKLPSDEGEGTAFSYNVYYDLDTDRCLPFFYHGQGGNANRFKNERECLRNCSVNSEKNYPMDATKACHFKHLVGGCSGHYLRYYYDPVHDKCKKFIWTGCFGNGNRFFDYNSCNKTCVGIHDDGDDEEEIEWDTPIAVICGVLLAVVVFAVIITVAVLVVKSKQKKEKKRSGGKSQVPKSETPLQDGGIEMS